MSLPEFQTADLCDALGDAARVASPVFRCYGGAPRCAGPARTIRCQDDNSKVRALLETPGDGAVLLVDGGGSLRCALLGDKLAQLAVDNGWAGVIVHGCIRDSTVVETLPLAVRALGTHPRKSVKGGKGEVDVELAFAGVVVRPGEWVYADADGWFVTAERVQDVEP